MKAIWTFKTKNFEVSYHTEKETFDGRYMEPAQAQECREKIRSGEWKCFTAVIEVRHRSSGLDLGAEYLGQCIYADPKDFIDHRGMNTKGHGSYFSQMVREALKESRHLMRVRRMTAQKQTAMLQRGLLKAAA